jgi:tRNA threonylcarbamoyl adenosine modification protein YjeE
MECGGALAKALTGSGLIKGSGSGPGSGPLILLIGPLGAGKTTFVKGFGKELTIDPEEIVSPSFSLAHNYLGSNQINIAHLDLYRLGKDGDPLSSLKEFLESGLDEYLSCPALIEWPERLPLSYYPIDAITVTIEPCKEPQIPIGHIPRETPESQEPKEPQESQETPGRLISFKLGFEAELLRTALRERGLRFGP